MADDARFIAAKPLPVRRQRPIVPSAGQPYPGKRLGTIGTVIALLLSPIGIIICLIAFLRSGNAGFVNHRALAGLIFGTAMVTLAVVVSISAALTHSL